MAALVPARVLTESPDVRWVFPRASERAVSILGGRVAHAWYDILAFDRSRLDDSGIAEACDIVSDVVRAERESGPGGRQVVLVGFSQGGSLALHAGLALGDAVAGIFALAAALPYPDLIRAAGRARRESSWATAASTVASRTRWASRATGCLPRGATTSTGARTGVDIQSRRGRCATCARGCTPAGRPRRRSSRGNGCRREDSRPLDAGLGARSRRARDGRLARNRSLRRAARGATAPSRRRSRPLRRRRQPGLAARDSLGNECSPGARAPSRTEPRGGREPQPGGSPEQQPQRSIHGSSSARRPPGEIGQRCLQGVQAGSRDRSFHG